jgi:predicted O-methyltransferase YrrM
LLYSLIRFTKRRRIVEVGAGYTTLWILQALKDNDIEMQRIKELDNEGRLKMLDYPFGTPALNDWDLSTPSSLLCIDNCDHQRETASSAVRVAETLGLDSYIEFLRGDAFDALETHFSEEESIDLLWCDFGVGSRMAEYASNVWKFIKPGGFLVCHSTLTNRRTREWVEGVRGKKDIKVTGIPSNEYVEISLLEGKLFHF